MAAARKMRRKAAIRIGRRDIFGFTKDLIFRSGRLLRLLKISFCSEENDVVLRRQLDTRDHVLDLVMRVIISLVSTGTG